MVVLGGEKEDGMGKGVGGGGRGAWVGSCG